MKYYRVKLEKDGTDVLKKDKRGFYTISTQVVGTELFTEKELKKYCIPHSFVVPVEISKTHVHWFFGSRFENGHNTPWMN